MSGPKYGEFTLSAGERARQEAERQRRLEMERRQKLEELKRREEEKRRQLEEEACIRLESHIKDAGKELVRNKNRVEEYQADMVGRYQELLGNTESLQEFLQAQEMLAQKMEDFSQNRVSRKSEALSAYLDRMRTHLDSTRLERHPHIAELAEVCIKEANLQEFANAESLYYEVVENMEKKTVRYDLGIKIPAGSTKLTTSTTSTESVADDCLGETLNEFQSLIIPLIEALPEKKELKALGEAVESIVENRCFDSEYKLSQIQMRLKGLYLQKENYLRLIAQRDERKSRIAELVIEHELLCSMLGRQPIPKLGPEYYRDRELMEPAELERRNSDLFDALRAKEERAYIATSLNEVMLETGHHVVADEVMETTEGERYHSVYSMNEHAGINVYHSPGGAVMFEVSGFAGAGSQVSDLDRLRVKESMEDFCTEYETIKAELAARGIDVSNEKRKPSHEKYARFVDISTMNRTKKSDRKRRIGQNEIRGMMEKSS